MAGCVPWKSAGRLCGWASANVKQDRRKRIRIDHRCARCLRGERARNPLGESPGATCDPDGSINPALAGLAGVDPIVSDASPVVNS